MDKDKKDLTGIHEIQSLQAENPEPKETVPEDPFAVNVLPEIEKIDSFESLDQIGMMDHPSPEAETQPQSDPFESTIEATTPLESTTPLEPTTPLEATAPIEGNAELSSDPFAEFSGEPQTDSPTGTDDPFAAFGAETKPSPSTEFDQSFNPSVSEPTPDPEPSPFQNIKTYSEKVTSRSAISASAMYPFHLKISGVFGPFERDKLLLFLNDHPIGLSSSELDLQIQSGRVFFPRISEYSIVKLIQELRDSGLSFQVHPSDQDESSVQDTSLSFSYEGKDHPRSIPEPQDIPVISATTHPHPSFSQIEEISMIQFVKTEVIEVENSPILQEVMDRMVESLKQKARLKGGNALFDLRKEITPLRLPSQYQISLKANVVRLS